MRKGIIVLLLVTLAIMLVMAAPAFAKTGTKSGGYWPYNSTTQSFSASGGSLSVVVASAASTANPHAGYSTTTGKCKVCHAVHGAGIATNVSTTTGDLVTEKLLRGTAADACITCHVAAGAFAIDPYAPRTGAMVGASQFLTPYDVSTFASLTNYFSNDSDPAPGVAIYEIPQPGGLQLQDSSLGRSGHSYTHGHDNPQGRWQDGVVKSYQGCVSCHSVHGANAMTLIPGDTSATAQKPNILKKDPAKGVTSADGAGWAGSAGMGYGSLEAGATTQAEFCDDCHDGTKLVKTDGTKTPIVSNAQFNAAFPSCGANGTSGAQCHNSVQTAITESIAQFGAFNNPNHDGRSHIMTAATSAIGTNASGVTDETVYASGNGCTTCHNIPAYSRSLAGPPTNQLQQGATFPHFWPSNELIQNFNYITQSDRPCMRCHAGVGTDF